MANPYGTYKEQLRDDLQAEINASTVAASTIPTGDANTLTAANTYSDGLITQVKGGVGVTYDTLKKLADELIAIKAIIGDSSPDADNIIDTITELMAVLANYPEGTDLFLLVQGKVDKTDVYNALDCIVSGKVADARQLKVLNDFIVAMGTSVKGDKITPSTTPAGTGVGAWLIAEAGTYIGGNVLPANSLGFLLRNASNVYSVTYTSITGDYASNQEIQRLGKSLTNEQINYINPSLSNGGLLNLPVNNWLFIPSQNVLKDGHLLSLSVPLINAQTGRTVRFQVLEKTGTNDFKLKFQTDAILAETAGTFTYNLPNSFKVLAGYYIGAVITTSNTTNSIGYYTTGGNSPTGWGGWNKSSPTTILETNYTASTEPGSRGFPIYATFSEEILVKSDKANKANGFVPKNSANKVPKETIFESDFFAGKKIIWIGTSIPAGGGVLNYPKIVGELLNCTVINEAVGSSGMVWNGTRALTLSATKAELNAAFGVNYEPQSYENKIIGKGADYLVIDHGYNDTDKMTGINLGTINSTDKSTFYGSFNFVIQAALTDKPDLKLIFITPPNRYEGINYANGGRSIANIDTLRGLIFDLAKKHNSPVCDLALLSNIHSLNYAQYKIDTVHPIDADRPRLAHILASFIKQNG